MSMTDPDRSVRTGTGEVRGRMPGPAVNSWRYFRETKPSFMTTEFWFMVAGIVALAIIYNVADDPSLDLFRTCLLGTIGASAYFVSRGFAKSGSHDDRRHGDDRYGDDRY